MILIKKTNFSAYLKNEITDFKTASGTRKGLKCEIYIAIANHISFDLSFLYI